MPTFNEQKKASLAEFSITYYQRFLAALNHNNSKYCGFPDKILCLNFYFKQITRRQYELLFPFKDDASLRVSLNRLVKKGFLTQLEEIPTFHAYGITAEGSAYIRKKLSALFDMFFPLPVEETYHFTKEDVISYLETRLSNPNPSYWHHFFGIRDFYFTFLSSPLTCSDFLFLQECVVENGRPLTIYQQQLNRGKQSSGGVSLLRSDGLLMSQCPAYPSLDIPMYLEFDSGSQRSSVLVSKVQNYLDNSLPFFRDYFSNDGLKVHMPPSIVFCISSKYATKKRPEPSRKLSRRKYRGCLVRASELFEVVSSLDNPPDIISGSDATLNACINLLDSLNERLNGSSAGDILPVLLKYREEFPSDISKTLSSILRSLNHEKTGLSKEYENDMREYYSHYYKQRKALLWNNVLSSETQHLEFALLNGLSIFTVSHELLPESLPYLIPELYWYSSSLSTFIADFGCYNGTLSFTYEHLGRLTDSYLFRNHYMAKDSDGTYHFYIENISDDLGGYYRINHLLKLTGGGYSRKNSKVLCIVSESFLEEHWREIAKSEFYKSNPCSFLAGWNKSDFELLFCTPSDFEAGRFFLLLPDGKRCYKVRS